MKKIKFDNNPVCGDMINYPSNGIGFPENDRDTDISRAFNYGFRKGWQCCWEEMMHSSHNNST